jgi:GNAT superfamily N-acetyltransferase
MHRRDYLLQEMTPLPADPIANVPRAPELESNLAELRNKYWAFFNLDWSEDPSKRKILLEIFAQTFDKEIFSEAWHLENAVVSKDYQRRGIGALLVQWGLDQAEAERVPACVESSHAGLRLYEKMGFRIFNEIRFGDKEIETFPEMVWEPSGMKGQWYDRAKAAADGKGMGGSTRLATGQMQP